MSTSVVINRRTGEVAKLSSAKAALRKKGLEMTLENLNLFYEVPAGKTAVVEDGILRLYKTKTALRHIEERKEEEVAFIQAPKRNARNQSRQVVKKFFDWYEGKYLEDTPENRQMVSNRNTIEYNQLEDFVQSSRINIKQRFVIQLKSINDDRVYDFDFKNVDQMSNALKLDDTENYLGAKYALDAKQYFETVQVVGLKNVKGGCDRRSYENQEHEVDGSQYLFQLHAPNSKDNSCAYKAIEYHTNTQLSNKTICQRLGLQLKEKKTLEQFRMMWELVSIEPFFIIGKDTQEDLIEGAKYIILHKEHYSAVKSFTKKEVEEEKAPGIVNHNILTWDCETRPTDEFITIRAGQKDKNGRDLSYKSYKLKDTITSVSWMGNRGQMNTQTFTTTQDKSSIRQFIDFLKGSKQKYRCYAHNGASFDNYFFLSNLTEEEFKQAEITKLGLRFAKIKLFGHELTDSRLHLISSLETLCKNYKVETAKLTEFKLEDGRVLSNKEMCFYKPELSFDGFIKLKETEPFFWSLYQQYCEVDCISLYQVWTTYNQSMRLIADVMLGNGERTKLSGRNNVAKALTIGSGAMKLLEASCEKQNRTLFLRARDFNDSVEKEEFLRLFIRGGISHTGQPGAHHYKIADVDISSQYPSAMYYAKIPVGQSRFVDGEIAEVKYNRKWNGYVKMKDVVFSDQARKNKFIAIYQEKADGSQVLNWNTSNQIDELYLDTVAINYYLDCGLLESFKVSKALVSDKYIIGKEIYGLYIETLFNLKAQQDVYKELSDPKCNPSMRESIKLLMNSVSGKCNENKLKHTRVCSQDKATSISTLNGYDLYEREAPKLNSFLPTGLSIYSYSKVLLREYVECLPNGSDNMIHAETDGFMFRNDYLCHFKEQVETYKDRIPKGDVRETLPIAFGKALGNIGVACISDDRPSYFLGKKNYLMSAADKGADLIRLKGIPQKSINEDGSDRKLVSRQDYENMFDGKQVKFTFPTLLKTTKQQVCVSSHMVTRSIKLDKSIFSHYY